MAQQVEDALSKIGALVKVVAASVESNSNSIPTPMHVNEGAVAPAFSIPGAPKRKKIQGKRSMLICAVGNVVKKFMEARFHQRALHHEEVVRIHEERESNSVHSVQK